MTGGDQAGWAFYYGLLIVLVGSSLVARRMPWRRAVVMLAAWLAIFGLIFLLSSYRTELAGIGNRLKTEALGQPRQQVEGGLLRVTVADDGHYWVQASVNGVEARFLIDSGASFTALSDDLARRAGVEIDAMRVAVLDTANGSVNARRGTVSRLQVGPLRAADLPVVVSPAFGPVNVLGMNFLSKLKSWRVDGSEMLLEP